MLSIMGHEAGMVSNSLYALAVPYHHPNSSLLHRFLPASLATSGMFAVSCFAMYSEIGMNFEHGEF